MSNNWLFGDAARLTLKVTDSDGTAADPSALRIKTIAPDKTVNTINYGESGEVIKDATGLYHFDLLLNMPGTWYWRWETDMPEAGAIEGQILVPPSRFFP